MQNVPNLKPCFSDGQCCHQELGHLTATHLVYSWCTGRFHSNIFFPKVTWEMHLLEGAPEIFIILHRSSKTK